VLCSTPAGVPIDIALGALPFEAEMIERATAVEFDRGIALRICAAEDLLALKAFADRPQDRADVMGIARRSGRTLDWDAIESRLAPLVEAKGDLGIMSRVRARRAQFAV